MKFGKRSALVAGGVAAVVALTLTGGLPASAKTFVGGPTSTHVGSVFTYAGYQSGYYAYFKVYGDYANDEAASTVHIEDMQETPSNIYFGTYAAPAGRSSMALDYANVILIGAYCYV